MRGVDLRADSGFKIGFIGLVVELDAGVLCNVGFRGRPIWLVFKQVGMVGRRRVEVSVIIFALRHYKNIIKLN